MTLLVDFNMIEEDGRLPALLSPEQIGAIREGISVTAADGEGTQCEALVSEVSTDQRIVLLVPIEGTWNRESTFRPSISDLLAD